MARPKKIKEPTEPEVIEDAIPVAEPAKVEAKTGWIKVSRDELKKYEAEKRLIGVRNHGQEVLLREAA